MAQKYPAENEVEKLFKKVLSPIRKEADPNLVSQFCQQVNNSLDGPSLAVKLILSKLHSTQEWEVIIVLYILEACVKNCGSRFHAEIAKFRFLNELIKLISPKYLASQTSEKVKKKVIELIYSLYVGLPNEPKIAEAYQMLKRQSIINKDPDHVEKLTIDVEPRSRNPIFEDSEKSKKLAKLLQSKNPQDLEEANRIIKQMVKQDELKAEKTTTRITKLEHINNNIKLLDDMLKGFNKSTSEAEKDTMKVVYDELDKLRPTLIELANETEDYDDAIDDIIKTNDEVIRVLNDYKCIVENDGRPKAAEDVALISTHSESDISQQHQSEKNSDPFMELQEVFTKKEEKPVSLNDKRNEILSKYSNLSNEFGSFMDETSVQSKFNPNSNLVSLTSLMGNNSNASKDLLTSFDCLNLNGAVSTSFTDIDSANILIPTSTNENTPKGTPTRTIANTNNSITNQNQSKKGIEHLNELGKTLLEQSLSNHDINRPIVPPNKKTLSLNEMLQLNQNNKDTVLLKENSVSNIDPFSHLTELFVPLDTIKPNSQPPLNIYEANGIKIILHFGRDSPMLHVNVIVISVTSTNPQPIKKFLFSAAVPKSMRVKLQPASSNELNGYNPILPMSAITQVMLIANPTQDKIRLKFKISYSINEQQINESGEIADLKVSPDLL